MTLQCIRRSATALAIAGGLATATAQDRVTPSVERAVTVTGRGPHRLEPDVDLVAGAARGRLAPAESADSAAQVVGAFADLRLLDAEGREVPYLLMPRSRAVKRGSPAQVVRIPATKTTSGFEIALASVTPVAAIDLEGLPAPFMKRVRIEGSVNREHWVELAAAATIFNLPAEGLRHTLVPLPPGDQRYLRVVGDDAQSAPLPLPAMSGVSVVLVADGGPAAAPLSVAVPFAARTVGSRTLYRLRLPGERLPIVTFRIEAANSTVLRTAVVWRKPDGRGEPMALGQATIRRVARDGLTAGDLDVPVRPPQEDEVELDIDNAGNPPLEILAVHAVFAQLPRLYFVAPDSRPLVARFGRPDLTAPSYDLEAARDVVDVDGAAVAVWGPVTATPSAASSTVPISTPVPVFGGPLDRGLFRFARALPPGAAGVTHLAIDAAVLAHSGAAGHSLHDLRLADAQGRQVPYLLERLEAPVVQPLALSPPRAPAAGAPAGTTTAYDIELPYAQLPPAHLVVTTSARVFSRRVSLVVERPADARHRAPWTEPLTATTWRHVDETTAAPPLRVAVPSLPVTRIVLQVDEGDNQPLPLVAAAFELPAHRLRFLRPADTELDLLYGNARVEAPRYDVADILRSPAGQWPEVAAGPERALDGPPTATLITPPMFWAVLAVATVVLLVLLIRLVRGVPDRDATDDPPATT